MFHQIHFQSILLVGSGGVYSVVGGRRRQTKYSESFSRHQSLGMICRERTPSAHDASPLAR
jgi:hypothetical protein